MTSNAEAIQRLSDQARAWGGKITIVSEGDFWSVVKQPGWTFPPEVGHALHYQTKEILVMRSDMNAGIIVHEMGHAFADLSLPHASNEWNWLGWEICLARNMDCYRNWSTSTREYIVEWTIGSKSWPAWKDLPSRQKQRVAEDRIQRALELGLITASREPIAIR